MKILITSFLLSLSLLSKAQTEDINYRCACVTYNILFERNFETFFPPDSILKNKVSQLTVYVTPFKASTKKDTNSIKIQKPLAKEQIHLVLKFDPKGYVSSISFYSQGLPNTIYKFERNFSSKIIKETFLYLDSTGKESKFMPPQISDYSYDVNSRLILKKQRSYNGEINSLEKSSYTSFDYDSYGRVIKSIYQYYYDGSPPTSRNIFITKYSSDSLSAEETSTTDGKNWLLKQITYHTKGLPLKVTTSYSDKELIKTLGKNVSEENYTYDIYGRVIKLEHTGHDGGECSDLNNYTKQYEYKNGLIISITHNYTGYSCELRFEYK